MKKPIELNLTFERTDFEYDTELKGEFILRFLEKKLGIHPEDILFFNSDYIENEFYSIVERVLKVNATLSRPPEHYFTKNQIKTELKFENQYDLNRLVTLLKFLNNQLIELEDAYCCDNSLYNDMALVDSVINQLKEQT